jgi:hypothetical protein
MYWGFDCISTASAKQGFRSDVATAFATSVDLGADVTDPTGLTDIRPAPRPHTATFASTGNRRVLLKRHLSASQRLAKSFRQCVFL